MIIDIDPRNLTNESLFFLALFLPRYRYSESYYCVNGQILTIRKRLINNAKYLEKGVAYPFRFAAIPEISAIRLAAPLVQYTTNQMNEFRYVIQGDQPIAIGGSGEIYESLGTLKFMCNTYQQYLILKPNSYKQKIIKKQFGNVSNAREESEFLRNSFHRGKAITILDNEQTSFIVMPNYSGSTLKEIRAQNSKLLRKSPVQTELVRPLALSEILLLCISIAKAVDRQLHKRHIVHNDLHNPGNILVKTDLNQDSYRYKITTIDLGYADDNDGCNEEVSFANDVESLVIAFRILSEYENETQQIFLPQLNKTLYEHIDELFDDMQSEYQEDTPDLGKVIDSLDLAHFELMTKDLTQYNKLIHQHARKQAYDVLSLIDSCFYYNKLTSVDQYIKDVELQSKTIKEHAQTIHPQALTTFLFYLDCKLLMHCQTYAELELALDNVTTHITFDLNLFNSLYNTWSMSLAALASRNDEINIDLLVMFQLIDYYFSKLKSHNSTLDEVFNFTQRLIKLINKVNESNLLAQLMFEKMKHNTSTISIATNTQRFWLTTQINQQIDTAEYTIPSAAKSA